MFTHWRSEKSGQPEARLGIKGSGCRDRPGLHLKGSRQMGGLFLGDNGKPLNGSRLGIRGVIRFLGFWFGQRVGSKKKDKREATIKRENLGDVK